MVNTYARPMIFTAADARAPSGEQFMEFGRRKVKRDMIPVEDYTCNGKTCPGARSLVRMADGGLGPQRFCNGAGMPRNFLAPDDTTVPVVKITAFVQKDGMSPLAQAENFLTSIAGKTLYNDAIADPFIITKTNINEIISTKDRSEASATVYARACENNEQLVKHAVLLSSHENNKAKYRLDSNGNANKENGINQVHRLFSAFDDGGKTYAVKITVKEMKHPIHINLDCMPFSRKK